MKTANIAFFVPHLGCPHRCSFCDQASISGRDRAPGPDQVAQGCRRGLENRGRYDRMEIAFFGGSFTAIPRPQMIQLLEAAAPFVGEGKADGIRISTRPDALSGEVLEILRFYQVTAVELGAQSMDDRVLAQNGRGHTAAQVEKAARMVKEGGFSLGLQMMTGLWGDSDDGALETARRLAALGPDTMRIYPTVVLRGTGLDRLRQEGKYQPPGVEETIPLCARLLEFFEEKGIPVIRLGLHASRQAEEQMTGGCYHPALRELCQGQMMVWDALERIRQEQIPPGPVTIGVAPGWRSRLSGQRGRWKEWMARQGYPFTLWEDEALSGRQIWVRPGINEKKERRP